MEARKRICRRLYRTCCPYNAFDALYEINEQIQQYESNARALIKVILKGVVKCDTKILLQLHGDAY
jgi:hypothetical protein